MTEEIKQLKLLNQQIAASSKKSADAAFNTTTDGYSVNVKVVA